MSIRTCIPTVALVTATLGSLASPAMAQHYLQTNLTSDQSGMAANMDPNLVNPWGMSRSSGSPWWISDNGTGLSTLYNAAGVAQALVVTIPPADPSQSPTGTPTGTVFSGGASFLLAPAKPALFMFVTEDGTVSGWNPGVSPTSAVIKVNTKSASVFKGAALATVSAGSATATYLYAADFRKGRIQVFDQSFNHVFWIENAFADADRDGTATAMETITTHTSPAASPPSTSRTSAATSTSPLPSRTPRSTMKSTAPDSATSKYSRPPGSSSAPSNTAGGSTVPGASPWRRETSVPTATTCWSDNSAPATSPSTIPPAAASRAC